MRSTATPINTRRFVASIDVCETGRMDMWCRTFGVTRQQLCAAVSDVGSNPDLVRRYLRRDHPVAC